MTYRNKLLLRHTLIVLGIILAVLALAAIIGFTYLGRYVVYTENGAYFSFHSELPQEQAPGISQVTLDQVEVIMGQSISADEILGNDDNNITDTDVNGILVDYETLQSGVSFNALGLDTESCNTLVLEMRSEGSEILSSESVLALIDRAKGLDLRLIALISCLDDSDYALDHHTEALSISGGALWVNSDGNYYLDPTNDSVINYLAGLIHTLAEMGFQEVILDHFSFPYSDSIIYDTGDSTRDELLVRAYEDLLDATVGDCDLGLLITDPEAGHQAQTAADRLYAYFSEGSQVGRYAEEHKDQYLVFITASHDTRFDGYGKIFAESGADLIGTTDQDAPEEELPDDTLWDQDGLE